VLTKLDLALEGITILMNHCGIEGDSVEAGPVSSGRQADGIFDSAEVVELFGTGGNVFANEDHSFSADDVMTNKNEAGQVADIRKPAEEDAQSDSDYDDSETDDSDCENYTQEGEYYIFFGSGDTRPVRAWRYDCDGGMVLPRSPNAAKELSRSDRPLRLIGNRSDWSSILKDNQNRCFFAHSTVGRKSLRCAGPKANWLRRLHDELPWQTPNCKQGKGLATTMPTYVAWLTGTGCSCGYSYGGRTYQPGQMNAIHEITNEVCAMLGIKVAPNSCNLNWFEGGEQALVWHADDEMLFGGLKQDKRIISLSLGGTRKFELKPCSASVPDSFTGLGIRLKNGDVCAMEGRMQAHYKHCVREGLLDSGDFDNCPRVSLTWRWITCHQGSCVSRSALQ
jgi:alkylated DNA repair dioxygenase AlkB